MYAKQKNTTMNKNDKLLKLKLKLERKHTKIKAY